VCSDALPDANQGIHWLHFIFCLFVLHELVTHLSTNDASCTVTSLMLPTPLLVQLVGVHFCHIAAAAAAAAPATTATATATASTTTSTNTNLFNGLFSRTTWVSQHQKGKTFWILMKQEMMGWQWHQLDHTQIICISLQTDNRDSTPLLSFYSPDALPAAQPAVSEHWRQLFFCYIVYT